MGGTFNLQGFAFMPGTYTAEFEHKEHKFSEEIDFVSWMQREILPLAYERVVTGG